MVRPEFPLGLLLPTCLLLVLLAAQGGNADDAAEQLRVQKAMLSELEYNKNALALKEPWVHPSVWLSYWTYRATKYFTSPAQVSLLDELNAQNAHTDPMNPWDTPSAYLDSWIARMRATLQD
ncbi:hypothetical protein VOLCADRAFT_96162 [Volvox carteri f. nagariensis]|uniref:Uncharacterized protein n=1 Tax=Volvox carteri f. nagariensis TaxID=3068 RepID=D8U9D4_VOLCA|nr:uncharacterized protein VOLCADRAFT_96162 [Volvox carteri f. nagariensis]EFJ43620.1 hypothetical protein VOLCADRAFT_96162 [Volvox carteri f. nagariensis]|eukprot:XP_002955320.1 hypothetical protein VOLCADRAFT_96162 [Volvox carteri f. nagariensis]